MDMIESENRLFKWFSTSSFCTETENISGIIVCIEKFMFLRVYFLSALLFL